MPAPVVAAIREHLDRETRLGGYEAADAARAGIDAAYHDTGALIGAAARNMAVVENATVAFAQALSAYDFEPGDVILTTRNDYASNQLMYLSLAERRGVTVVRADDRPEGGVDPESVRALAEARRPAVVALTWVPTSSGLVQPAEAVGEICAELELPYLVDACQAVGQMPVDVAALHCDFLAATARKFLRGPRGIGFLYVSDRALDAGLRPLYIDMRGADWVGADRYALRDDARRFENWEFPYALVLGLGAAVRYARDVGSAAGARSRALAAALRTQLDRLDGVRVLDRGPDLCAIVSAEIAGREAAEVVAALRDQGINTSALDRVSAVIDLDEKGVESALRLSPHYFNTEAEIRSAVAAIAAL
ncbi:MAG: aminotransferase class V-fold PLP-dependent enzyme [Gemmatimonadetes bacterium]|nr:aminotransferase class V-fold PLP-dependent enzyme [Gemmatimonadota bacterium]NIQ53576.1 aminotransferase class V-fold PLP-dependent enzyme [Gemmatimonadota bacterium]NIU73733.1 aminotransferase class V-fold PLP-dependent enzyme [Gammaproteobacteria bacterium]NIX43874.1 aminotransferase class V-fold PLP-dependent enzyme [Gemmatimonadota bacterium]NIY08088.1 aminotransferase class V-fold PLP-dependent enzyme [Gemmatimonadota bacterium]